MKLRLFAAVCLLAIGAGTLVMAQETAPASQAGPEDAALKAVLQRLGNDDFAHREAAQKELDKTTFRDLERLQRFADAENDPEIKSRLVARVQAIHEDLAVNPPPISLELKDAMPAETGDALSKALGIKLDVWPPNFNPNNQLCTISAKEKPFWEIMSELSSRFGMGLQDIGSNQLRLLAANGNRDMRKAVIIGPVAIFPQSIIRQRVATLQNDKGSELGEETCTLTCQVSIDPRVQVVAYSSPVFTEIVDDAGNTLFKQVELNDGRAMNSNPRPFLMQNLSTQLAMPAKKGTRITSAKGMIRFTAQVAEERVEIADLDKKTGQDFDIAGGSIRLTRFTVQENNPGNVSINLSLDMQRAPTIAAPQNPAGMGRSPGPAGITATLLDGDGKTLYATIVRGGMGVGMGGNYAKPFKLRLSAPTKTKDVEVPFELKDLVLP